MTTYYEVLDIPKEASMSDVKKAYFKKVRQFPPEQFEKEFMEIRLAYETLSNAERKMEYDVFESIPKQGLKLFKQAKKAYEEKELEEALYYLEHFEAHFPTMIIHKVMLGNCYIENGNTGKAVTLYEKLVKLYPNDDRFKLHLGNAYLQRGFYKKAKELFLMIVEKDNKNKKAWIGLFDAYMNGKDYKNAERYLLQAIEIGKSNEWDISEFYYALIHKYAMTNEKDSFIESLTSFLESEGQEKKQEKLLELTNRFIEYGIADYALLVLEKIVKLYPRDKKMVSFKNDVERYSFYSDEVHLFKKEKNIPQEIRDLIQLSILPVHDLTISERSEAIENCKFGICICYDSSYQAAIKLLKEKYPKIYNAQKEFFDMVKHPKKRDSYLEKNSSNTMPDFFSMFGLEDEREAFHNMFKPQEPVTRDEPKIGRNNPCPCGSGKKYKKCCA